MRSPVCPVAIVTIGCIPCALCTIRLSHQHPPRCHHRQVTLDFEPSTTSLPMAVCGISSALSKLRFSFTAVAGFVFPHASPPPSPPPHHQHHLRRCRRHHQHTSMSALTRTSRSSAHIYHEPTTHRCVAYTRPVLLSTRSWRVGPGKICWTRGSYLPASTSF